MRRSRALLLYLALSVPFGIAVHLASEFAGLGRDADDLAFSPLHAYLALIAVAALTVFLIAAGFFHSAAQRRRRIGQMAGALPFGGRGPGFFAFSASLQFAFFMVTQFGEGCPLCHGDLLVGILAALAASAVGAVALIALRARIVRVVVALCCARERLPHLPAAWRRPRHVARAIPSIYSRFAPTLGNRPPPSALLAR